MKDIRVGCAMTGSFCTFDKAFAAFRELKNAGADLLPVMSDNAFRTDTRFQTAEEAQKTLREITQKEIIHTVKDAEPIGPRKMVDIMVVMPCTGNTVNKIANGIVDTPASMAVKSTLRTGRPVLIAVSTNDGLGLTAKSIGLLLAAKNVFFVPFRQDDPVNKPQSLVARFDLLIPAVKEALQYRQIQPILAQNP